MAVIFCTIKAMIQHFLPLETTNHLHINHIHAVVPCGQYGSRSDIVRASQVSIEHWENIVYQFIKVCILPYVWHTYIVRKTYIAIIVGPLDAITDV
uniref:Uncharacterized protein n=1 Tax=Arundo donax TaxID=35708 RepID=A0A0A9EPR9_ARUDO